MPVDLVVKNVCPDGHPVSACSQTSLELATAEHIMWVLWKIQHPEMGA